MTWKMENERTNTNYIPLLVRQIFVSAKLNSFEEIQNAKRETNSFEPELNQWPSDTNNMLIIFCYSPPLYQLSYGRIVPWCFRETEDKYNFDVFFSVVTIYWSYCSHIYRFPPASYPSLKKIDWLHSSHTLCQQKILIKIITNILV